jgi:hypothetical protein
MRTSRPALVPKEKNTMNFCRTLVAIAAAILMASVAWAAPTPKQTTSTESSSSMTKVKVHHEWGVVDSMTDTDLVLTHTYKGKTENVTFKLDPNTKKVGTVDKGSHVEVYYKMENGEHVATEVKASKS